MTTMRVLAEGKTAACSRSNRGAAVFDGHSFRVLPQCAERDSVNGVGGARQPRYSRDDGGEAARGRAGNPRAGAGQDVIRPESLLFSGSKLYEALDSHQSG